MKTIDAVLTRMLDGEVTLADATYVQRLHAAASETRHAQVKYFADKSGENLAASKAQERNLDAILIEEEGLTGDLFAEASDD